MTWNMAENAAKTVGWILGGISVVTVLAKSWAGAAKDKCIEMLEKQLTIALQRTEQCDKDILHYREELHQVRNECNDKLTQSALTLLDSHEKLKKVEIENATLLARTDLTPVMSSLTEFIVEQRKFTKEQTEINERVLQALQQLTEKK